MAFAFGDFASQGQVRLGFALGGGTRRKTEHENG